MFLFIVPLFFRIAQLLTKKAYEKNTVRYTRTSKSFFAFLIVALLGFYGYLRLEFPGVIVYMWDTVVECCIPTGEISGFYLLAVSGSAILGMISYHIYRFVKHKYSSV